MNELERLRIIPSKSTKRYTKTGSKVKWMYIESVDGDLTLEEVLYYIIRNATYTDRVEDPSYAIVFGTKGK
jgi:hypothetical protein